MATTLFTFEWSHQSSSQICSHTGPVTTRADFASVIFQARIQPAIVYVFNPSHILFLPEFNVDPDELAIAVLQPHQHGSLLNLKSLSYFSQSIFWAALPSFSLCCCSLTTWAAYRSSSIHSLISLRIRSRSVLGSKASSSQDSSPKRSI